MNVPTLALAAFIPADSMREAGEFPKGLELLGQRTGLFIFPNIFLRIPKPVLYEGQRLLLDFFVLCAVCSRW